VPWAPKSGPGGVCDGDVDARSIGADGVVARKLVPWRGIIVCVLIGFGVQSACYIYIYIYIYILYDLSCDFLWFFNCFVT
jgi:hypothetical protein